MNIFILDNDQQKCVEYHIDKHVVKMVTEYAQLLSYAVRLSGIDAGYKLSKSHSRHPCTLWTCESLTNWLWLKNLTALLNEEWKFRYGHVRDHKAYEVAMQLPYPNLEDNGLTPFVQCMPEEYRQNNPIEAYREFYRKDKITFASWKLRGEPSWFHLS